YMAGWSRTGRPTPTGTNPLRIADCGLRSRQSIRIGTTTLWIAECGISIRQAIRNPQSAIRNETIDGLPADGRAEAVAPHGARVRGNGNPSPCARVGSGAAFSDRADSEARLAGVARHPVSRAVRRRRDVGDRLLHLHRRARARRSGRRALGCRPRRPLLVAHFHLWQRGTETEVS